MYRPLCTTRPYHPTYHYDCMPTTLPCEAACREQNTRHQNEQLHMDRTRMEHQVRKGLETMRQKNNNIGALQTEVTALRSRIDTQQNEITFLRQKLEEKDQRAEQCREQAEQERVHCTTLQGDNACLQAKLDDLAQELREAHLARDGYETKHQDYQNMTQQHNQHMMSLRDTLAIHNKDINDKQALIAQLKAQNKQLLADLQHKANTLLKKDTLIQEQNDRIAALSKELTNTQQTLMDKDSLISAAEENKNRVQQECNQLEDKVHSLQEENSRLLQQKASEEVLQSELRQHQEQQHLSVTQQVDLLMDQPQERLASWPASQEQMKHSLTTTQHYLSSSIATLMNQVFLISGFGAKCRSLNSLPAFYQFMDKFSHTNGQALTICCYTYQKLKTLLRSLPSPHPPPSERDEGNRWLETSIQEVKAKLNKSGGVKEQRCNTLFRYLAIQYRLDHPLGQIPFRRDADLSARLQDKTVVSLLKYLIG